jgi:hypothetical protein
VAASCSRGRVARRAKPASTRYGNYVRGDTDNACSPDPFVIAGGDAGTDAGQTNPSDAGANADAAVTDAGNNAAATDAGIDASNPDQLPPYEEDSGSEWPTGEPAQRRPCTSTDWALATSGLEQTNIWITRLRTSLPQTAFDADLRFEASPSQNEIHPFHSARESGGGASITSSHPSAFGGTLATWTATLAFLAWLIGSRKGRTR